MIDNITRNFLTSLINHYGIDTVMQEINNQNPNKPNSKAITVAREDLISALDRLDFLNEE